MYRSSLFLAAALVGTNMAFVQPIALAKSAVEVGRIAKAITVEIKQVASNRVGSGILLQRQDDLYTVLTAGHVVESGAAFTLKTSDGQVHKSIANSVKLSGSNIDLGVLKFRATKNYTLATIGTSKSLEALSSIYVAGFPESTYAIEAGTLNITKGEVIGNATKGNASGYSLIYSNTTFRGMSGGPVLNEAGELVAIHGQGDRDGKEGDGEKTGRNLGIVVERFGTVALAMDVQLNQQVAVLPASSTLNTSDYFLRANGKYNSGEYSEALADFNQAIIIDPKNYPAYNNRGTLKADKLNDIQGALSDFNQAIIIDPKNYLAYNNRATLKADKLNDRQGALKDYNQSIIINSRNYLAYNNRGSVKLKLNDIQGALSDFNQAIIINPKSYLAYNNRGWLKHYRLNDIQGALKDYNQSIIINPQDYLAYHNRGFLKNNKLNDIQGALKDYNQSIIINPKNSKAYYDRGFLKYYKLNDRSGGIQDLRQATRLFRQQGKTQNLQLAIEALQEIGATE
jgi:tetratricopeptide (TPR) repeat protein